MTRTPTGTRPHTHAKSPPTDIAGSTRHTDAGGRSPRFMNVRQAAEYLHLNEKKVYALVAEGKIPATKITGKWLFPRDLVDQWMLESTHGGILTDRLLISGSDDPLIYRAVMQLATEMQARALISYTVTGTQLGLSLLARHRADACGIHWGPAEESALRHPALIRKHTEHRRWVLVRAFYREQGLMLSPGRWRPPYSADALFCRDARWAMRQDGAGSQRFLQESLERYSIDASSLRVTTRGHSEREVASMIAMGHADIAPGARAAAAEFGLGFFPIGWEAFDFALHRGIYFRTLFQKLLERLKEPSCRQLSERLGGYDLSELGRLVWSD